MKHILVLAAFVAAVVVAHPAVAQTGGPLAKPVTVSATIEAIDQTNRLVTLKGEKGNVVTVKAGPEVERFSELKVGDTVSATYYESVAVNVRRPGDPAPPTGTAGVTSSVGAPGKTIAAQETVTVNVVSVDKANRSVTVKKQDGSVVSMRVEQQKYLDMVKAGDTVDITMTAALLMEVKPGK